MNENKKLIIKISVGVVIATLVLYVGLLLMRNWNTAFLIERDPVTGERRLQVGDIHYYAGAANHISPTIYLNTKYYDEENEVEIQLCVWLHLFKEDEMVVEVNQKLSNDGYIELASKYLQHDGTYVDVYEHDEQKEEIWKKYTNEIQMIVDAADQKWDIID